MKYIYIALFAFLIIVLIWNKLTRKYDDEFTKVNLIIGLKGKGKSMMMCKLIHKYLKMGCSVYTTENVTLLPKYRKYQDNLHFFSIQDFGKYKFPINSVIFIDEIMSIYGSRDFKNFDEDITTYLTLNRKARNRVYLLTQTMAVDANIRRLSERIYLLSKWFRVLTVARQIDKEQYLKDIENCKDSDSQLVERMSFRPFWIKGALIFTWIPHWVKCTSSYDIDKYYSAEMPYNNDYFAVEPSNSTAVIKRINKSENRLKAKKTA